jgi:hypothetical protein
LHVQATDGPGAIDGFQSLMVTVSKVKVHLAGEAGESAGPNDETGSGWTSWDLGKTFDLVALQNGYATDLVNKTLTPGHYTQVRFTVVSATGVLKSDGSQVDVTVPDHQLKVVKSFDIGDGLTTTFVFDIHVVHEGLLGTNYHLEPVAGSSVVKVPR